MEPDFKYDVAFSLLSKDEPLARQVSDLLAPRYQTFLYSGRQDELAGTDGEFRFKDVFARQSRLVVVLYRPDWGKTPWTRFEEDAIRGRAYDEGYGFVKFVPLETPPTVPVYLPKTQLWIDTLRFGPEGVAAVIEARLAEMGVPSRQESVVERSARLQRELSFKQEQDSFQHNNGGVDSAKASFESMQQALAARVEEVNAHGAIALKVRDTPYCTVVSGLGTYLFVRLKLVYANSLEESGLDVEIWKGHPPFPNIMTYGNSERSRGHTYKHKLTAPGIAKWLTKSERGQAFGAEELADAALNYYMDNGAA